MKYTDYFDYDGNIPSEGAAYENAASKAKKRTPASVQPATSAAASLPPLEPPKPSLNEAAVPQREATETVAPSAEAAPQDGVSAEELAAAIKAFENLDFTPKRRHVDPTDEEVKRIEEAREKRRSERQAAEQRRKELLKSRRDIKANAKKVLAALKRIRDKQKNKEVSRLKHFFIIVMMLVLVIAVTVGIVYIFFNSINKENLKSSKFNANAAKVCADYSAQYGNANYENLYSTYKVEGYRLVGLCFVRELDFDNDGNSELMVAYNKNGEYYNEVWGLNSTEKFELLFSEKTAQTDKKKDDVYSVLYRTGNKYYIAKFSEKNNNKMSLYQLKSGSFKKKYKCVYDPPTKSYAVDGKDDTDAFERIRYAVLKEEKASACVDETLAIIDGFTVGGVDESKPAIESQTLNGAYYSLVQDYNKKYGVSTYKQENGVAYIDGLAVVRMVDFDGDGQNELLLVYRKPVMEMGEKEDGSYMSVEVTKYFCDIYRYASGRAVQIYSNEGLSNSLNSSTDVYYMLRFADKKAMYCINSFNSTDYGKHITAVSTQLSYDGNEFKTDFKASYQTDYGYSEYFLDGEEVGKTEFNEKGYVLPFFDGDSDYDKMQFNVTYLQQSSMKIDDMKEIPKKTEKEIQKLNQAYSAKDLA